jgi:hypothetical protein
VNGAVSLADRCRLAYSIEGEAWYAGSLDRERRRQVIIMSAREGDGIDWDVFVSPAGTMLRPRLATTRPGRGVMRDIPGIIGAIQSGEIRTVRGLIAVLREAGALDETERDRP